MPSIACRQRFAVVAQIIGFTLFAAPLAAANPGAARLIDLDRSHGCSLAVAEAGKALLIEANGLIPGESYRFTLINGDMKPVDFAAYANGDGRFVQYYVPFRFNRDGGMVQVRVAAANCTLEVAAPWSRAVPVID
ncbi:MAG: hypothetical protein ACKOUT_05915 [Novosphingobium sp.]